MRYCTQCGTPLEFRVPEDDNRQRYICPACGHVHYQNPKVVAGCIVCLDERILLCRRAIEPRKGYWTLPAGFLENGETTAQGAIRETLEEACAEVEDMQLFSLVNVPLISQIHMFYLSRLHGSDYRAGAETLDVALVSEQEIPWQDLAFPTVFHTLRLFYKDCAKGQFGFHPIDLDENAWHNMAAATRKLAESR